MQWGPPMTRGKKLLACLALSVIANFASGCATNVPVFDFCLTQEPFRPTSREFATLTDRQKDFILAHNLRGQKQCGWKP